MPSTHPMHLVSTHPIPSHPSGEPRAQNQICTVMKRQPVLVFFFLDACLDQMRSSNCHFNFSTTTLTLLHHHTHHKLITRRLQRPNLKRGRPRSDRVIRDGSIAARQHHVCLAGNRRRAVRSRWDREGETSSYGGCAAGYN